MILHTFVDTSFIRPNLLQFPTCFGGAGFGFEHAYRDVFIYTSPEGRKGLRWVQKSTSTAGIHINLSIEQGKTYIFSCRCQGVKNVRKYINVPGLGTVSLSSITIGEEVLLYRVIRMTYNVKLLSFYGFDQELVDGSYTDRYCFDFKLEEVQEDDTTPLPTPWVESKQEANRALLDRIKDDLVALSKDAVFSDLRHNNLISEIVSGSAFLKRDVINLLKEESILSLNSIKEEDVQTALVNSLGAKYKVEVVARQIAYRANICTNTSCQMVTVDSGEKIGLQAAPRGNCLQMRVFVNGLDVTTPLKKEYPEAFKWKMLVDANTDNIEWLEVPADMYKKGYEDYLIDALGATPDKTMIAPQVNHLMAIDVYNHAKGIEYSITEKDEVIYPTPEIESKAIVTMRNNPEEMGQINNLINELEKVKKRIGMQ
ncbi:MAG: hypothetical protein SPI35_05825 [Porphyromonas sp.]|nr:hypothetical protein [Porphyromonas sp.]